MAENEVTKFGVSGINHLALVCKDMKVTVDFYENVLGFPLIKTLDLPYGSGQHFFFDIGGGDSLAFFWFPEAPDSVPGTTHPANGFGQGSMTTAHATMNHVAFNIDSDRIVECQQRLVDAGVEVTPVINHDHSETQASLELTDTTFVRSIYFKDPDGIMLEFAGWTRPMTPDDVEHAPATDADKERYLDMQKKVVPAQ